MGHKLPYNLPMPHAFRRGLLRKQMMKYKLNVARDVDADDDGYILNLPNGYRFDDDLVHVRGYDTMKELRQAVKTDVIPCDCKGCTQ